jgi:3-dehydroquinate dehydratase-2
MINVLILHGPNLNLLGEREPEIYGKLALSDIDEEIKSLAHSMGIAVKCFQSNHEGALIDFIHEHRRWAQGMVFNPGALTHYSYSLRDAIAAVQLPTVEVHISDIHAREPFRSISVIAQVCLAQIYGRGLQSYLDGLKLLIGHLQK